MSNHSTQPLERMSKQSPFDKAFWKALEVAKNHVTLDPIDDPSPSNDAFVDPLDRGRDPDEDLCVICLLPTRTT